MATKIKKFTEISVDPECEPNPIWQIRAINSDECLSYVAWNTATKEAVLIDPKRNDVEAYRTLAKELSGYLWIAVIDTHTHADHISIAADFARELSVPLVMHASSPSQRVTMRVTQKTHLATHSGDLIFIPTPGHTQDAMCVLWGPFLFTGDTLLFGDTGRDDLPGGDATAHFESIEILKKIATPKMMVLPGHDQKGGRASSWGMQLKVNPSLTQERESFIQEAGAYSGPAPQFLKESLKENFK